MRRVENRTIPSDAIKKVLDDYQRERQARMAKATRRGGRGRHTRKKTISDMSGMLVASSPEEQATERSNSAQVIPSVIKIEKVEENLRKATVPGEFRKVNDPFGKHGLYGRLS